MSLSRIIALALCVALVAGFFAFDLGQYLTLDYLKAQRAEWQVMLAENPVAFGVGFFVIYVAVTALSLPGAAIMTLAAGAVFGLWWGLLLVSFASTVGATLAMLVARFLLRDQVQRRFADRLAAINVGMEKEGAFYLFTLRLIPAIPFFVINLAMGLVQIPVLTFFLVSQVGMLAGTLVFVNAGTQLADIQSLAGILSPELIASFVLLGVFPLVAKRLVDLLRARQVYKGWTRPRRFDQDVIVIGAGSGGLVAALIAATVKAEVTLIEKDKMGGDCLNTGCVPSKALIRSAKLAADMGRGPDLGFRAMAADFDFADIMERVQRVISTIEPHDSVERYQSLGVHVEIGEGRIVSPFEVQVNGRRITTRNIIVATGASPFVPPIEGLDQIHYLTSENLWELRTRPGRLVVLGGGPIGTELAQSFARLGSEVTQVEMLPRIMIREDLEISEHIEKALTTDGAQVLTSHTAKAVVVDKDGNKGLRVEGPDGEQVIGFDEILVAVGRKANVTGFGLEELGVVLSPHGTVEVDEYLRTNFPNIYAIGDVAGPYQFTHTASHMAWYATVNALFGTFWKFKVDYSVIPWATFSAPEVARVGLNETEAVQQGVAHEVTTYDVADLDRAIADEAAEGMVKVITAPGKGKLLGATIMAEHAGELISEFVLAMKHGITLQQIMGTIHVYPTFVEMNKFAASEWRKRNKPEALLEWVGRFHTFRRGGPVPTSGAAGKSPDAAA